MRSHPFIVLVMLLLAGPSIAQPHRIGNYVALLQEKEKGKGFEQDTGYINLLVKLADSYNSVNIDSQLWYAQKAYDCAAKTLYTKGEARSLRSIGDYYNTTGDYAKMLSFRQQALSLAEQTGDKALVAHILMNVGSFYMMTEKYDEALADYNRAYGLIKEAGDSVAMAYVLVSLGGVAYQRHDSDGALQYYRQALQVARGLPGEYTVSFIRVDIGAMLCEKGRYAEALDYFSPSMRYYRLTNDKLGIIHTQESMAEAYSGLGLKGKALRAAQESITMAQQGKNKAEISEAAKFLAAQYEKQGDYRKSLKYLKLYGNVADSLFNDDTRKKTAELEAKYEYEKKASIMQAERAHENSLHAAREKILGLGIALSLLAIFLLSAVVIFLQRSRAIKEKSNRQLEGKNSEITLQNAQIEKQAELLRQSNRQKDQLFSIIAHDLRGPLMSLKGLLDFLKEKSLSEVEIAKTVNSLNNNVNYTAELVNNLLYWARNQMDGIHVAASPIQLEPLAGSIVSLFAGQAGDKKIEVENRLDKQISVFADKDMILLVLRNVVSNAIKFCRPGGRITIEDEGVEDGLAKFYVADTGIGIKEEMLLKINNNESVTTFGTSSEKGTGLGLLLCKEFIEKNGGRFRILSEWGKGSRVCLSLPVG